MASKPKCRNCGQLFEGPYRSRYCSLHCKLFSRVTKSADGCWLWTGTRMKNGYGVLNHGGELLLTHRVSFRLHVSDPGELLVCHHCDTPDCVNPAHLFLGTHGDNMADMAGKGRSGWQGRERPEETRRKISESRRGTPTTELQKEVASRTMKALWATPEFRARMVGRTPHNKGQSMDPETRERMQPYWESLKK